MVKRYDLVLALYPTRRGMAFVLFEGPLSPVDWGHTSRRTTNDYSHCLKKAADLFSRQPDVLVLQDTSWTGTHRSRRATDLNDTIFELAEEKGFPVCALSRERVRAAFNHLESPTRYAIAQSIAKNVPVLDLQLPPPRKRWLPEDPRMGIFDAAALALTFFQSISGEQSAAA